MSEWKIALAAWVTLSGFRILLEEGRMEGWQREGAPMIFLTRGIVVLLGWGAWHLWLWAIT